MGRDAACWENPECRIVCCVVCVRYALLQVTDAAIAGMNITRGQPYTAAHFRLGGQEGAPVAAACSA